MPATQAEAFKPRSVGNTTVSTQKFGLMTSLALKSLRQGQGENPLSSAEFYPAVRSRSPRIAPWAVLGSAGKIGIWPKFVSSLTYGAGPWHVGVVGKPDCGDVIKNCIRICVCEKGSINRCRMPPFGDLCCPDQVTQWPSNHPLMQPLHGLGSRGRWVPEQWGRCPPRSLGLAGADGKEPCSCVPCSWYHQERLFVTRGWGFPFPGGLQSGRRCPKGSVLRDFSSQHQARFLPWVVSCSSSKLSKVTNLGGFI